MENKNIVLIGMTGAGKSFIGRELARKLDFGFIDTDNLIEERAGITKQEIIDNLGEEKYLEIEKNALLDVLDNLENNENNKKDKKDKNGRVISTGGSAIYLQGVMNSLKEKSVIVFIDVDFEVIQNNIKGNLERGIIGLRGKSIKALKELYDERKPLYKKYSDISISVKKREDLNVLVRNLIKKLPEEFIEKEKR